LWKPKIRVCRFDESIDWRGKEISLCVATVHNRLYGNNNIAVNVTGKIEICRIRDESRTIIASEYQLGVLSSFESYTSISKYVYNGVKSGLRYLAPAV
jgi:hypothetical protein